MTPCPDDETWLQNADDSLDHEANDQSLARHRSACPPCSRAASEAKEFVMTLRGSLSAIGPRWDSSLDAGLVSALSERLRADRRTFRWRLGAAAAGILALAATVIATLERKEDHGALGKAPTSRDPTSSISAYRLVEREEINVPASPRFLALPWRIALSDAILIGRVEESEGDGRTVRIERFLKGPIDLDHHLADPGDKEPPLCVAKAVLKTGDRVLCFLHADLDDQLQPVYEMAEFSGITCAHPLREDGALETFQLGLYDLHFDQKQTSIQATALVALIEGLVASLTEQNLVARFSEKSRWEQEVGPEDFWTALLSLGTPAARQRVLAALDAKRLEGDDGKEGRLQETAFRALAGRADQATVDALLDYWKAITSLPNQEAIIGRKTMMIAILPYSPHGDPALLHRLVSGLLSLEKNDRIRLSLDESLQAIDRRLKSATAKPPEGRRLRLR